MLPHLMSQSRRRFLSCNDNNWTRYLLANNSVGSIARSRKVRKNGAFKLFLSNPTASQDILNSTAMLVGQLFLVYIEILHKIRNANICATFLSYYCFSCCSTAFGPFNEILSISIQCSSDGPPVPVTVYLWEVCPDEAVQ